MKARLQRVGILCVVALVVPAVVRGEDTAPVKATGTKVLRLPENPYNYANVELPAHFRTFAARRLDNMPADNPITDHGATLGRVLFYDTRLSANNTTACASCHHQKNGFVDPNKVSKGFEGKMTDRHAPSLAEVRFAPRGRFFWDERAATLEQLVLMPIQSKIELGQDLNRLNEILAKDKDYQQLFTKAFGDSKVTSDRIAKAVAQFLRSMVSYQSKYDEGMVKAQSIRDEFPNFTAQENRGKTLFVAQCARCHLPGGQQAHFVLNRPRSNGLDADIKNKDAGVGDITLRPQEMGLFKSPSLRNVEFTAPYMHDGRLANLDEVIEHYSKNVKPHPNVDGRLRRGLNFTNAEKAALVAFLKTLSDTKFITDPRFADPFVVVSAAAQPAPANNPPARTNAAPQRGANAGRGNAARGGANVERALDDLKLTGTKLDKATAIVETNRQDVRKIQTDSRTDLLAKIKAVLSEDEYKKLTEATAQGGRGRGQAGGRGGRGARGAGQGGTANLERALDTLNLSSEKQDKVAKLIKASQESVRKDLETARGTMLTKMKEVLSADEFKKFKDATDRTGNAQVQAAQPAAPQRGGANAGGNGRGNFGRGGANVTERALDDLKLSGAKLDKATAIVEANREEARKIQENARKALETARAEMLKKMKDILSADELKKFTDATDRAGNGLFQAGANPTVDQIVERILSFGKDGKVSKDQLPERMQDLLAKGGTNVLDKDQVRALAVKLQQEGLPRGLFDGFGGFGGGGAPQQGGANFARGGANVERALDDLKLSGAKLDKATAFVEANRQEIRKIQTGASTEVLAKIKEVLSEEEFKKVKEASERAVGQRGGRGGFGGFGQGGPGNNLERALDDLKLAAPKQEKVTTLLKDSREGVGKKLDQARADLLKQMKDVLSDDEFKKFQETAAQPGRFGGAGGFRPGAGR